MSTMLRIGPHDHGREMTLEEYLAGDYEEGYRYELIRGELQVSPQPNPPHDIVEEYVHVQLALYQLQHKHVLKRLSAKAMVFVPGQRKTTCPEPDLALYNDQSGSRKQKRWEQVRPFIVVEIVSGDPDKDYVRNVDLYQRVPTILEYWLFDKVADDDGPTLRVYRRDSGDEAWLIENYGPEAIYTTPLLPGFSLPVSPDAE